MLTSNILDDPKADEIQKEIVRHLGYSPLHISKIEDIRKCFWAIDHGSINTSGGTPIIIEWDWMSGTLFVRVSIGDKKIARINFDG